MARLRNALLLVALATGGVGCTTFCDECDDFPVPGGPGGYHMMPGSYTGPPMETAPGTTDLPAHSAPPSQAAPSGPTSGAGAGAPASGETAPTPPAAAPANPGS